MTTKYTAGHILLYIIVTSNNTTAAVWYTPSMVYAVAASAAYARH